MFKNFSRNQRIVAIVGLIVVLVVAYIFLFYRPLQARIAEYDTTKLEARLKAEQKKTTDMHKMNESITANKQANVGTVEPYDNQKNEITALHDILAGTGTYQLEFSDPVKSGKTVRRQFTVTYAPDALTYDGAAKIATDLYHCKYRCLVRTIEIDPSSHAASIEATFIETTEGATTTAGLSSGKNNSGGEGLAGSDMSSTTATRQD